MISMIQAATSAEEGLTLVEVLSNIPHDPAAVVIYILSAGAIAWVLVAGTRGADSEKNED